jgi:hypothetical protein
MCAGVDVDCVSLSHASQAIDRAGNRERLGHHGEALAPHFLCAALFIRPLNVNYLSLSLSYVLFSLFTSHFFKFLLISSICADNEMRIAPEEFPVRSTLCLALPSPFYLFF